MSRSPSLTRDLGTVERTLRALLERQLEPADLTFPEWTVLVFLDTVGPLSRDNLIGLQLDGRIATEDVAGAAVDRLGAAGRIAAAFDPPPATGPGPAPRLVMTASGAAVFGPVRERVSRILEQLYHDLPAADLEATNRTLAALASRADAQLDDCR